MSRSVWSPVGAARVWMAVMAMVMGCSGGDSGGAPLPLMGGQQTRAAARPEPSREGPVTAADLRRADQAKPRPRRLPTISAISWDAFPDDLKGPYGNSGKVTVLGPGKAGAIAEALFSAGEGDTILLRGGTYEEGLPDDDAALRIDKDRLVLRAVPGQRPKIVPRSATTKRGLLISGSHVMVQGLDLSGFSSAGIGIGQVGKTVRGTILSDLLLDLPGSGQWVDGINIWPDMRSSGGQAAVDGLLIRNVVVRGASLGVSCNAGPCNNLWFENLLVRGAPGTGSGADAVAVESGSNVVLVNVETSGASADGIDLKARNVLVWGCKVHHVARNGLKLWYGGDVVNTVVHHTGADASIVMFRGTYRLLNCLLAYHNYRGSKSYNLTAGYNVKEKIKVSIINSIFYNTSGGMYFSNRAAVTVSNCLFHGIQNGNLMRVRKGGRTVTLTPLAFGPRSARIGLGKGNRVSDPGFVDPAAGDFRLKEKSAALDRGAPVKPFPAVDIDGAPRVQGKGPDIGPYERAR